jgi:hypothetical protein
MRREFLTVLSSAILPDRVRLGVAISAHSHQHEPTCGEVTVAEKTFSGSSSVHIPLTSRTGPTKSSHRSSSVSLSKEARAAVQAWAKMQPDRPRLNDAIQRLVQQGLATD